VQKGLDVEKITEQVDADRAKSMLQMKRPLLPIAEYAKREGVSTEVIEECAELGIAQIRKFKGKTYVVDVPLVQGPAEPKDDTKPRPQALPSRFQFRFKNTWQLVTLLLSVVLFFSVTVNLWFYSTPNSAAYETDPAYPGANNELLISSRQALTVNNELAESTTELQMFQSQLAVSKIEIENIENQLSAAGRSLQAIQNELTRTQAQLVSIQNQLTPSKDSILGVQNALITATQNIQAVQRNNAKVAEQLKQRTKDISTLLTEVQK